MNQARSQMAAGIPEDQEEAFRAFITGTINQVEKICKKRSISPSELPRPSYRAYRFLKSIDLQNLPSGKGDQLLDPCHQVRVRNLNKICTMLHERMEELLHKRKFDPGNLSEDDPEIVQMLADISEVVADVERICQEKDVTPGDLPGRSQKAFQWLCFLSNRQQLLLHLGTLATAIQYSQKAPCRKKLPAASRKLPVMITFYNTATLYRSRLAKDNVIDLVINEGFIGAHLAIIQDLICAALTGQPPEAKARVKEYSTGEEFNEISLALILSTGVKTQSHSPQGQAVDLEDVFHRINGRYFDSKLEIPQLTWNKTITMRKFGHYQPDTDMVMISITLDTHDVPGHVIDFVMYHELLHKDMGVKVVSGQRRAHTPAFRSAEKQFENYEESSKYLDRLTASLR